jgi:adenosylcobinamide kinase / adenosylcobinamide-phosphate guanylyltransferase
VIARSVLILGGARSGKSRRALTLAEPFTERYYIATAEARDAEMTERITQHRRERGKQWQTIEELIDLRSVILGVASREAVCVIDCLTLWLMNLLEAQRDVSAAVVGLCETIAGARPTLIFVSNELGLGLVPETALGRKFRDEQGRLNQAVANAVDQVEFIAAGLPIRLKP